MTQIFDLLISMADVSQGWRRRKTKHERTEIDKIAELTAVATNPRKSFEIKLTRPHVRGNKAVGPKEQHTGT
jgi:hypothetical protein